MSIVGIPLSAGDLWLLGGVGACIAWLVPIWRDRHNRFVAASATFRAAFSDTLLRITASHDASHSIVLNNHDRHLLAIADFQPYVSWYLLGSFKSAAKEYSLQASIQLVKLPLTALLAEGLPWAQEQRAALLASVEHLLKYASET